VGGKRKDYRQNEWNSLLARRCVLPQVGGGVAEVLAFKLKMHVKYRLHTQITVSARISQFSLLDSWGGAFALYDMAQPLPKSPSKPLFDAHKVSN